jgi:acetyl esterase
MPLHPRIVAIRNREGVDKRPSYEITADEARKRDVANLKPFARKPAPVAKRQTTKFKGPRGDVPVRVYTPRGRGPFPVIVYFHGGGFVIGSLDTAEEPASLMCNRAQALVVSVDYGLAPEQKFPAAPEDCYAALVWAHANAEKLGGVPDRMVVAGDSAGGTLALAVSIMSRERNGPKIALQLLVYPMADLTMRFDTNKLSKEKREMATKSRDWFMKTYFSKPSDSADYRASPLRADMHGMPPTAIVTAQYDALTKQVNELAKKLRAAGVRVKKKKFLGMSHGFWDLPGYLDESRLANEWLARQVRELRRPSLGERNR